MNLFQKAKQITLSSDYKIRFGKYKNSKLIEVYQNDIEYFNWLESLEDKEELLLEINKLKSKLP